MAAPPLSPHRALNTVCIRTHMVKHAVAIPYSPPQETQTTPSSTTHHTHTLPPPTNHVCRRDWLKLWDHLVAHADTPSLLPGAALAFLISQVHGFLALGVYVSVCASLMCVYERYASP